MYACTCYMHMHTYIHTHSACVSAHDLYFLQIKEHIQAKIKSTENKPTHLLFSHKKPTVNAVTTPQARKFSVFPPFSDFLSRINDTNSRGRAAKHAMRQPGGSTGVWFVLNFFLCVCSLYIEV